jgi:hypothetical protein
MRQLVESLARLYKASKVTRDYLTKLVKENKISQKEYEFIVSE